MQLPQAPTEIPPVRKYTRDFKADRSKIYMEGDVIRINIPPIDKTYLTKNSKLYFDYDLSYNEGTLAELQTIFDGLKDTALTEPTLPSYGFFGYNGNDVSSTVKPYNIGSKIIPTLDINGAYGLISRIQVHDYLGNTLLEDISNHDLLTATMNEFWFDGKSNTLLRPNVVGNEGILIPSAIRKYPCTLPFNTVDELDKFLGSAWGLTFNIVTDTIVSYRPKVLPTLHCSLDLVSFLGILSDKFVPLHNGFTISLTVNKPTIPICFNSFWGEEFANSDTKVLLKGFNTDNPNSDIQNFTVTPSIHTSIISNVRLSTELLELSSELDGKVEKVIHAKMYKYQLDFLPTGDSDTSLSYRRRILPSLKSLNKVIIGQRYKPFGFRYQKNGYRIKNFVQSSTLEYNRSIVAKINDSLEAFNKLTESFGNVPEYLQYSDFVVDEKVPGSGLQRWNPLSFTTVELLARDIIAVPTQSVAWFNKEIFYPTGYVIDTTYGSQGKFLIVHNCSIPGATPNSVAGIDTSSNVVEYTLESSSKDVQSVNVDVFLEHDAFIHVDPGKATAVSF